MNANQDNTAAQQQVAVAEQFARDHVQTLCQEIIVWDETGVLAPGKMRELESLCSYAALSALRVARELANMAAIRRVAQG